MAILNEAKRKLKDKNCQMCGNIYSPTGSCSKFCDACRPESLRLLAIKGTRDYRIRNGLIQIPGVGKGGNAMKGIQDSSYKTGIAYFQNSRKRIKDERRYCERCKKDLLEATRYHWVVHHRDHDRTHNIDENFELLCKRCHQLEHNCHLAFNGTRNDYPEGE